jgi:hypothetical protein
MVPSPEDAALIAEIEAISNRIEAQALDQLKAVQLLRLFAQYASRPDAPPTVPEDPPA